MELKVISTSRRLRTENEGVLIEATVVVEGDNTRIESGNLANIQDGSHIGSFAHHGATSYNFRGADRNERMRLATLIEDFIEAATDGKAE